MDLQPNRQNGGKTLSNKANGMMGMRYILMALSGLALAACEPAIPNSGYVGAGDKDQILRDAQLSGLPAPSDVTTTPLDGPLSAPLDATNLAGSVNPDNPGLSDENNFTAVAERQTIESDAERLARNRQLYTVIEPTAVPTRSGTDRPNIVQYAIETSNPIGVQLYTRSFLNTDARTAKNCAKYASSSQAQEDFLKRGGPKRDPKGLDPDGDGFACYWDPTPFRAAVQQ